MTVESKPLRDQAFSQRLLIQYLMLLKAYPILTKSITSSVLSALGNILAQLLENRKKDPNSSTVFRLSGPARFAVFGLLFTGPVSHYFYLYLEQLVPATVPFSFVKKLLVDRLLFAPAFLLLFFLIMNILEGKNVNVFLHKMKSSYWSALKMNWKVWTPLQFINLNYVPIQFRVLFANLVSLFWYAYLASARN
ncbi:peroxisomal membrane protein 2 [Protopterus annectens]|uniref:peroxisomal membrane protein 2 n=1 Tax=Protopterus annectens TaxID=7888 RepID=UPI001CFB2AA8|nr:peroxisomal membrane protein 2 [Protopterus annectens]